MEAGWLLGSREKKEILVLEDLFGWVRGLGRLAGAGAGAGLEWLCSAAKMITKSSPEVQSDREDQLEVQVGVSKGYVYNLVGMGVWRVGEFVWLGCVDCCVVL